MTPYTDRSTALAWRTSTEDDEERLAATKMVLAADEPTPTVLGQPGLTDYRNPSLASLAEVLGFAQRFGAGIPIARKALRDNGNPDLEFEVYPSHVLATLRPAS